MCKHGAAVAAISCTKEPVLENDTENTPETENPAPEVELVPMTFTASYADESENEVNSVQSKVAYENGATVWKVGDLIMVISSNGTATEFKAVEVDGSHATFEGLNEKAETYYAVSPASAYVDNDIVNGKIYANIPQNQTAVAGTFDREAFLSVATNSGSELYFKNSCSVIGFKLSDAADVKSVRFTANGQTNLAGTGYVGITGDPTHRWDGSYEHKSSYDMITLNAPDGGFVADTDYFLTIRQNTCPDGITVYIEYDDIVKSRTSENRLFPEGVGAMNKVRRLGQFDKDLVNLTPYETYNLGFDIIIAGKTINNATYGNANLISSNKGLEKSGVYFVDGNATATFNSGITGTLIVIGNTPGMRSNISRTGVSYLTASESTDELIMQNVKYVDCTANLFQLNSGTSFETIIFDNCLFNVSTEKNLILSNSAANTITDFRMSNCDIKMAGAVSLVKMGGSTINSIGFDNNILYSDTEMTSFLAVNTTAAVNTVKFLNNTLYNTTIGTTTANEDAVIKANSIYAITAKNNYLVYANSTANRYLSRATFTGGMIGNNFYIRKSGTSTAIYGVPGTKPDWVTQPESKAAPGNLTTDWDPEKGNFILGGYTGIGATR